MEKNTIYLGYYRPPVNLEAIGIWGNGSWDIFLAEDEHPDPQQFLFTATSIDEAYDQFYEWIEQHIDQTKTTPA
ncbi:hypothetical protein [Rossellomorea vietnamensis]|uniref:hypothetical protein n=1 Tax=Rossellomorea vietnamensis TaxID=218284 RepID=UPI001E4A8BAF|nr:hypothetical protein [Rossellomorea vietnamensis]MCC5800840.1 hypothetical protein [Rossellomorea vietnamensis]